MCVSISRNLAQEHICVQLAYTQEYGLVRVHIHMCCMHIMMGNIASHTQVKLSLATLPQQPDHQPPPLPRAPSALRGASPDCFFTPRDDVEGKEVSDGMWMRTEMQSIIDQVRVLLDAGASEQVTLREELQQKVLHSSLRPQQL